MEYFKEIDPSQFPMLSKEDYPDYFMESEDIIIDRLFRYKDCYIVLELFDNVAYLSIINVGESFAISCCREIVELALDEYGEVGFEYVKGIRNEILIKRLYSKYEYVKLESDGFITIQMKRGNLKNG